MADKYIAVIIRRKGLADQLQLNFSGEEAANNAFAKLHSLAGPRCSSTRSASSYGCARKKSVP